LRHGGAKPVSPHSSKGKAGSQTIPEETVALPDRNRRQTEKGTMRATYQAFIAAIGRNPVYQRAHDNYKNYVVLIAAYRNWLQKGNHLADLPDHRFLTEFFYDHINAIGSIGMALLSHDNFERMIESSQFLSALEKLILQANPSEADFDSFRNRCNQTTGQLNVPQQRMRQRRIVSACTTNVSMVLADTKLNDSIVWLLRRPTWTNRPNWMPQGASWYRQNVIMMDALKTEFATERKDPNVSVHYDDYWLSLFLWWVAVFKADDWNERDVYADNPVRSPAP
jgi:hypothetical protein